MTISLRKERSFHSSFHHLILQLSCLVLVLYSSLIQSRGNSQGRDHSSSEKNNKSSSLCFYFSYAKYKVLKEFDRYSTWRSRPFGRVCVCVCSLYVFTISAGSTSVLWCIEDLLELLLQPQPLRSPQPPTPALPTSPHCLQLLSQAGIAPFSPVPTSWCSWQYTSFDYNSARIRKVKKVTLARCSDSLWCE